MCRPFISLLDFFGFSFLFFFFCFFFVCAPHLSPKLSQCLLYSISHFFLFYFMRTITYRNTQKKKISFEFVQEDHTRTSKGRREGLSRREKRKTSRVVLKTFFSRAFEEGFFFARREEEEEEEEVVHSFVRVIFFFSKGRSKKGVALSRFPKRKARETNAR